MICFGFASTNHITRSHLDSFGHFPDCLVMWAPWVNNIIILQGEEYKWIFESSYIWTTENDIKICTQLKQLGISSLRKIQVWNGFKPWSSAIRCSALQLSYHSPQLKYTTSHIFTCKTYTLLQNGLISETMQKTMNWGRAKIAWRKWTALFSCYLPLQRIFSSVTKRCLQMNLVGKWFAVIHCYCISGKRVAIHRLL